MDELLLLLEQLNLTIEKQIHSFHEFVSILDQEENAISRYHFADIERTIILKDQHIRIAEALENKRVTVLNKICYMIAFDNRKQVVSPPAFKVVFLSYLENVKKLLTSDVIEKLENTHKSFIRLTDAFSHVFQSASLRINRNQVVLKSVMKHVNMSLNLFQTEADLSMNYDAMGKTQGAYKKQKSMSSVRVRV